jgi:hypothetical protein
MVEHYAQLAARARAELLTVGDELTSMTRHEAAFRGVIDSARRFFRGHLTYAANWVQEAEQVTFWRALDYIGVDAYMPLTHKGERADVAALIAAWQPWVARLDRLQRRVGRPVLFTELGYESRRGAAALPSGPAAGTIDQRNQAAAYAAAYRVWARVPWFRGIYWWEWSADGRNATTADGSYRPAGKLAEAAIRAWNGAAGAAALPRELAPPAS